MPSWEKRLAKVAVLLLLLVSSLDAQELRRVGRAAPFAAAGSPSRADSSRTTAMTIVLRLTDPQGLAALVSAQSDPASPLYRRWLSPAEFAERFGAPAETYARVVDWLRSEGFAVRTWSNRLRVDFTGTVGQTEKTFQVTMQMHSRAGRTIMANAMAPAVPAELADAIAAVKLHDAPLAEPLVRIDNAGNTATVMGPHDMHVVYNLQSVFDRQIDGAGQTIAVVARSDFNADDVTVFRTRFGVVGGGTNKVFPGANPGTGAINGVCRDLSGTDLRRCTTNEKVEVLLDVQWAGALAPGAEVLADIADTDIDASFADIVTNHPEAKLITISFGICERLDGGQSLEMFAPLYAQAAAQGQTVFVSTGDDGADNCQDGGPSGVNALASDPHVTAVGGTTLDPGFDSTGNATRYISERAWNDRSGAGGGGASSSVAKPEYQRAPGVPDDGKRGQPDVSLVASALQPGYAVIVDGAALVVGGTSVTAPSWASIAAVLAQASAADGFGVLNAALYGIGRKQYAFNVAQAFHDVAVGNISVHGVVGPVATVGYDLASGLGTPDVAALAQLLAACPGDCDGDGQVTVDELIAGVNIALEQIPLARCAVLDTNADGAVTLEEIVAATGRALGGCGAATPT